MRYASLMKILPAVVAGLSAFAGWTAAQDKPGFSGEQYPPLFSPARLVEFSEQLYLDGYGVIGYVTVTVKAKEQSWPRIVGKEAAKYGGELITVSSKQSDTRTSGGQRKFRVHVNYKGEVDGGHYDITDIKYTDVIEYKAAVWRLDPERARKQHVVYREEVRQIEGRLKLLQAVERHDLPTVQSVLAEGIIPTALRNQHPMSNLPDYSADGALQKWEQRRSIIGQAAEESAWTAEERQRPMFIALARSVKPSKRWEDAFETEYDYELAMLRIFEADDVEMLQAMVENGFSFERMPSLSNSFLHDLVSWARFKIIRYLAAQGISLKSSSLVGFRGTRDYSDLPYSSNVTPLHMAVEYDWPEAVGPLIRLGVDPNKMADWDMISGLTPLQLAAQRGRVSVAAELLANGADPQALSSSGKTARDFAREHGRDRVVECLNWAAAHPRAAFAAPWPREGSLTAAASRGELGVVRYMLGGGANVNARDAAGNSAIHYAVAAADPIMIGCLLTAPNVDVNVANKSGVRPLDLAGEPWLRSRLEKLGATGSASPSGLVTAARAGDLDLVRKALEAGTDPNGQDILGRTALVEAARFGHVPIMTVLLDKGVDARASDRKGLRPADVASSLAAQALILSRGGGIRPSVDALLLAVARNNASLMISLLDQGVDINGLGSKKFIDFKEFDGEENTALVVAATLCNESLAQLLLQRGASPNIEVFDEDRWRTALDLVRRRKCPKSIETLLLAAGAKTQKQVEKEKKGTKTFSKK